jgi:DNA-binding MarR family transcriptional regulator
MFPPPPDDPVSTLRRAVNALGRRMRAEGPQDGLPTGRLGVLAHLYRVGPSAPGAIAAALRVQPQSLTRTLAALTRDGLVSRSRDAADGRSHLVALTEEGFAAMARDVSHRDAWLRQRMAAELNETERELLRLAAPLLERLAGPATPTAADEPRGGAGGTGAGRTG